MTSAESNRVPAWVGLLGVSAFTSTYDAGFTVELTENSSIQNWVFFGEKLAYLPLHTTPEIQLDQSPNLARVFSLGPQNPFLILIRYKLWLLYYPAVSKTFPAYAPKENLAEKFHTKRTKYKNDS